MLDTDLVYELADTPGTVWLTRQLFATWLGEHGVVGEAADDLVLVCSELCTAALAVSDGPVGLRASHDGETVVIEISHAGSHPRPTDGDLPHEAVARAVVDELIVSDLGRRSVLRCVKSV